MSILEMKSRFFEVEGKTFEAIGTSAMPDGDCVDTIRCMANLELHKVPRSYTTKKQLKWLTEAQATQKTTIPKSR